MHKIFMLLFAQLLFASDLHNWFEKQRERSLSYLLENISRPDTLKGFVVASPSQNDPPYYFHWVRDAALVMAALDKNLADDQFKFQMFDDYINLVLSNQATSTLTGLGEPKFNPDGSGYTGPWGRPQNDGPALRAITLTKYALRMLEYGQVDYVINKLYRSEIPANTAIKRDLEYVSHHWRESDFDLWEEVKGTHFYTRMAQRSALILGSELAAKLGDQSAADWYLQQASLIDQLLNEHYSKDVGYILTTLNRVGGLDYKYSNLDSSVILAVNHSWLPGLSFGPTDERVLKTFSALVAAFQQVYSINNQYDGVAMGRYPEDTYYGGNPWFILTHAMAEYMYKVASIKTQQGINADNEILWAESFLKRVRTHMGPEGRMDEQFDRNSGYMLGARDLTWSYASFLTIGNP